MMKTSIISIETEIHLPKAWEMMQWVEHSTKFLGHPSSTEQGRETSSEVCSANVHHVQWSNRPFKACESFQLENDYALQEMRP